MKRVLMKKRKGVSIFVEREIQNTIHVNKEK
jgi:hypothetical protein